MTSLRQRIIDDMPPRRTTISPLGASSRRVAMLKTLCSCTCTSSIEWCSGSAARPIACDCNNVGLVVVAQC